MWPSELSLEITSVHLLSPLSMSTTKGAYIPGVPRSMHHLLALMQDGEDPNGRSDQLGFHHIG